jgi:hypothetical protein
MRPFYHVVRRLQSKGIMKKNNLLINSAKITSTIGIFALVSSCSTFEGNRKNSEDIASSGPTVLNAKADPATIDMNMNLQPKQNALIFADVKDFNSPVQNVHVRFMHVPIDLPMKQIAGTTWEAELSTQQLRQLAVSGQTIKYQATVIAMNKNGQTATSPAPISISIETPAPDQLSGTLGGNNPNGRGENPAGNPYGDGSGTAAKARQQEPSQE